MLRYQVAIEECASNVELELTLSQDILSNSLTSSQGVSDKSKCFQHSIERNDSLTPIPQQGYVSEDTENNQLHWSVGRLQVKQIHPHSYSAE